MQEFYVYLLIDPRTKLPIYVGKGKGNRMYNHVKKVRFCLDNKKKHKNTKLYNKLDNILTSGYSDVIYQIVVEKVSEEFAWNKEIETIEKIGLKNLCNILPGGSGGDYLKFLTDAELTVWRKKLSKIMTGNKSYKKGKSFLELYGDEKAEEIKKKISIKALGKTRFLGKNHTKETKNKLRLINLERAQDINERISLTKSRQAKEMDSEYRKKFYSRNPAGQKRSGYKCISKTVRIDNLYGDEIYNKFLLESNFSKLVRLINSYGEKISVTVIKNIIKKRQINNGDFLH